MASSYSVHGVLLEMHGFGVLLRGESGIGKSECALDLIAKGHRLVADDVVETESIGGSLTGKAPELLSGILEIRGLGIVSVRELFGVSAVCDRLDIDLCIELVKWANVVEINRIGLEVQEELINGVALPKFVLPVSSGRNLSTLVETAVRIFMLRNAGINTAKSLVERHDDLLKKGAE
jgi:HPr kinase/phosphorylase